MNKLGIMGSVITLSIAAIIIATTLPLGLQFLADAGNWTGVTGAPLVLGQTVLPIVVVAIVVIMMLRKVSGGD